MTKVKTPCELNLIENSLVCNEEINSLNYDNENSEDIIEYFLNNELTLTKSFFSNSPYNEIIINNKLKDKKADLTFPRKFFVCLEDKDDGQNTVSEKIFKINVLQPSLFENFPDTIYFGLENEILEKVSFPENSALIWRLSSITPSLIRETVVRSGFKLIKENSTNTRWIATWCKHLKTNQYSELNPNQKVNHFPGSFNFGRKDRLWMNIKYLSLKNLEPIENSFHPQTYNLPLEASKLKADWKQNEDMKMILKPPASARGLGIQIIHKFKQIPKEFRSKHSANLKNSYVAQVYLEKPLLLFNQTKFDIRLYVLLTSINPLRAYLYEDGLIRFASQKYSTNLENLNNQFMHLTNYSINKKSATYKRNDDENSLEGHKWTLKTFYNYISETMKHVNIKELQEKIVDLILKTIISCQYPIYKYLLKNLNAKYNSYELLGFDIIIDKDFKPWLLEVNISPSLRSESSVDTSVKSQLIKDMLNIVGYRLPIKYNDDPLNFTLTEIEKQKHKDFSQKYSKEYMNSSLNLNQYDFNLTEKLLPDDLRHLCFAEDELSRAGSFNRLFPSLNGKKYLSFFKKAHYRNYLLIEWEYKFSHRRAEAVSYLQSLCSLGYNVLGKKIEKAKENVSEKNEVCTN